MQKIAFFMAKAGILTLAISWLPLLAYALLGPADGNPIGLGLLFIAGTWLAGVTLVCALILGVIAFLRDAVSP